MLATISEDDGAGEPDAEDGEAGGEVCESGDDALIKVSLQWVEELAVDPVKTIR